MGGIAHRYSFTADASDSVGGADGTLVNTTTLSQYSGGELVLGNTGAQGSNAGDGDYVDLPNNMISANSDQATFELWLT